MNIDSSATLVDVAFAVCTALDRIGTTAVLTGGSAATYHAPDAYQSADIDFVITFRGAGKNEEALFHLGFERVGDYYRHANAPFPVEFPPGPLMVGSDPISQWTTDKRSNGLLHVLSPTDSCRDRLAALLFWNDFSGLEQALAVYRTKSKEISLDAIRAWCAREQALDKFELFASRVG